MWISRACIKLYSISQTFFIMGAFPWKRGRFLFNQNGCRQGSVCAWFCLTNFLSVIIYRESKIKVFMLFRTFSKLSYDKTRYFWNVFDVRTLLPNSHFWFYEFTSENFRHILITPKTKFTSFLRWPNYGRFCPVVCLFWLKNVRTSFLWKVICKQLLVSSFHCLQNQWSIPYNGINKFLVNISCCLI